MTAPGDRVYEFGQCRLETADRLLLRDGKPVPLTPKAFETLLALVRRSGHVVKKDDLMSQVWPDSVVEEANLARNVWTLRKALGDMDGEPKYIETIPKLGYRFVAPVTERSLEQAAQPAPPPAAPSRARRPLYPLAVTVLACVTAGLIWVVLVQSRRQALSSTSVSDAPTLLTDGRHDDVGASWNGNGLVYFSRAVSSRRVETWTMREDGSDQRRANTEIKSLLAGRWSPDGKKVLFTKDDGSRTAYLADADGGHEIALPFVPGNLDWARDGSQFVYQARIADGNSHLFLYSLATGLSADLTSGPVSDADPSFSNDGTRIAFTSWRDGNAEIYVMQADGSNVRRLTTHPAFDNYSVFSPDDTQIAFQSNRESEHVEIYLQNLNDTTPPRRLTRSNSPTGIVPGCWSTDGTRLLVYTTQNGGGQIGLIRVDPYPPKLLLGDEHADLSFPRASTDGRRLLYEARLADRRLELRLTDLELKRTKVLFRTEPDYPQTLHLAPAWSPDNASIAFSARANGNSEIFIVNADGTGLRNVTENPLLDANPAFSSDGREIVFARDIYGQAQLYRMDISGKRQRRVTGASGYEMNPALSPDGVHLAFSGDRRSQGLDIYLLSLEEPGDERVIAARSFHDELPSFSPDGRRLVFVANSDGNPEIYAINVDGSGLVRLTHTPEEETAPQFSNDGRRILFSSNRTGKFAIYEIALPN